MIGRSGTRRYIQEDSARINCVCVIVLEEREGLWGLLVNSKLELKNSLSDPR